MTGIRIADVPSAIAASKCWLHRNSPLRLTENGLAPASGQRPRAQRMTHPSECGWCAYPDSVLIAAVEEFMGANQRLIEDFERLPWQTQQTMVLRAQGAEGEPVRSARTSRSVVFEQA